VSSTALHGLALSSTSLLAVTVSGL